MAMSGCIGARKLRIARHTRPVAQVAMAMARAKVDALHGHTRLFGIRLRPVGQQDDRRKETQKEHEC